MPYFRFRFKAISPPCSKIKQTQTKQKFHFFFHNLNRAHKQIKVFLNALDAKCPLAIPIRFVCAFCVQNKRRNALAGW